MGASSAAEIDAWLRRGGMVVTASERAARAVNSAFQRARRAEGLTAWNTPQIQDWNAFVRSTWLAHSFDGRLLLNPAQEQSLWAQIAAGAGAAAAQLEGPRHRVARLAMEAHDLLCSHVPALLRSGARSGWQNDAAAFSSWLAAFDLTCRSGELISLSRLPLELIQRLQNPAEGLVASDRPPLLLAGFDRILPIQGSVFDAWGAWRALPHGESAREVRFFAAADEAAELHACALWCHRKLAADPGARILVVTQNANPMRGQIERAFLEHSSAATSPLFEFSLGIPLIQVDLARAALLLLRWLSNPLAEHELDWLFSTGYAGATPQEVAALQASMRVLRRRGLERPEWTLQAFLRASGTRSSDADSGRGAAGQEWTRRATQTQRRLQELSARPRSPFEWAEALPGLLESLKFAVAESLSSAEFQTLRRWQQAIETAGSLGFDGRRIEWAAFLSTLTRALEETLFAPESRDAPIQIAGPAESAGLTADAVWFLGASEEAWPSGGATHPLLPVEVQRDARMPHASPQLDWDLAETITRRLLASAPEVHFSYARQTKDAESRPSRLIAQLAAQPHPLPAELTPPPRPAPLAVPVADLSSIPRPPGPIRGGARVLTNQSQCPFKAFAAARLDAQSWDPAQAGLTPAQRGQLLHAVLASVWGSASGLRSCADLVALAGREQAWVAPHVRQVFATALPPGLRDRMPARYLELEQQRLTHLIAQWLQYESARVPFDVLATETCRTITLGGLTFDLRLDRIDRLQDGSVLVIDYKTGQVSPKLWELPRPDDVQLPLYAGFGLESDQQLGGLVFAQVRPGDTTFIGSVRAPARTLIPDLRRNSALAKNCLTDEQVNAWREALEQLAQDFLDGRAEVDPREYPETCARCGLQTLCRVYELRGAIDSDELDEARKREDMVGAADE